MKLIKLKDKFILVNDEEVIQASLVYKTEREHINQFIRKYAGIDELPSIDFSRLSEKDCLTIGFIDIERLARVATREKEERIPYTIGYLDGFNKSQYLNDKLFSLDDINTLANKLINWVIFQKHDGTNIQSKITEIIQSLRQTAWDVEVSEITSNSIKVTKIL